MRSRKKKLSFLVLVVKLTDDKIVTDLYCKSEDSHQYLHYDLCHAELITQETFALVKTYWRLLEDILKTSSVWHFFFLPRWLQDIITRLLLKTSWKCLANTSLRRKLLEKALRRHLEDVLKTFLEDVLQLRPYQFTIHICMQIKRLKELLCQHFLSPSKVIGN